jgi:hypothetical protein
VRSPLSFRSQHARAFDDFTDFRRRPAIKCDQRTSKLRQNREFGAPTLARLRLRLQQGQGAPEVSYCLTIVRPADGLFSGLPPVGDCLDRSLGLLQVQGDDLRRNAVGRARGQHCIRDAGMNFATLTSEKSGISCVLHKGMLEQESSLRKQATLKNQSLLDEADKRVLKLGGRSL